VFPRHRISESDEQPSGSFCCLRSVNPGRECAAWQVPRILERRDRVRSQRLSLDFGACSALVTNAALHS
jgi:hypothetical protein